MWWINSEHGVLPATTASLKQFAYTFFMGGWVVRLCSFRARRETAGWVAIGAASLVPSALTIASTFAVHSLRGTPEPLASTVPVALISPPAFVGWSIRERRAGESADARRSRFD